MRSMSCNLGSINGSVFAECDRLESAFGVT